MGQIKGSLLPAFRKALDVGQHLIVPPGKDASANIPARWTGTHFWWPGRIIVLGNGRGPHWGNNGYITVLMPAVGTVIPGYAGNPDVTVTADGIPIGIHTTLYAIFKPGDSNAVGFAVAGYGAGSFRVPDTWMMIASQTENGNNGMLKTCWGETLDFWRSFSFQNGWLDYGLTYPARYRLVDGIQVYMTGIIKSGTLGNATVATVPSGYRPHNSNGYFVCSGWNGSNYVSCYLTVSSSGELKVQSGTNVEVHLDGVKYMAGN